MWGPSRETFSIVGSPTVRLCLAPNINQSRSSLLLGLNISIVLSLVPTSCYLTTFYLNTLSQPVSSWTYYARSFCALVCPPQLPRLPFFAYRADGIVLCTIYMLGLPVVAPMYMEPWPSGTLLVRLHFNPSFILSLRELQGWTELLSA